MNVDEKYGNVSPHQTKKSMSLSQGKSDLPCLLKSCNFYNKSQLSSIWLRIWKVLMLCSSFWQSMHIFYEYWYVNVSWHRHKNQADLLYLHKSCDLLYLIAAELRIRILKMQVLPFLINIDEDSGTVSWHQAGRWMWIKDRKSHTHKTIHLIDVSEVYNIKQRSPRNSKTLSQRQVNILHYRKLVVLHS